MIRKSEIEKILKQCGAENRKAQKLVYEGYYERYFVLCKRYLRSDDLATDALNKMFYKVFTNIKKLQDPNMFEGWMKKICVNTCLNEIKKNKKHEHVDIEENVSEISQVVTNQAFSNLAMEELLELVTRLPWRMRSVFNLYVIDGYKHQEIAEQLEISIGTCKFHLHQARIQLQEMIMDRMEVNQPKKVRSDG